MSDEYKINIYMYK